LFFANAGAFRLQIRKLVRERQPQWVVLQCEAVTDVDVTAAEMLEQLDNELNAAGTHLAFAEMRSRLKDLTLRRPHDQYGERARALVVAEVDRVACAWREP